MTKKFTLTKAEKIKHRKIILEIVKKGTNILVTPIFAKFKTVDIPGNIQVAFSVSKKRFKKAVHRNRIKRLMREAYRLNKFLLLDYLTDKEIKIGIIFTYISTELPDFQTINNTIKEILMKIKKLVKVLYK